MFKFQLCSLPPSHTKGGVTPRKKASDVHLYSNKYDLPLSVLLLFIYVYIPLAEIINPPPPLSSPRMTDLKLENMTVSVKCGDLKLEHRHNCVPFCWWWFMLHKLFIVLNQFKVFSFEV